MMLGLVLVLVLGLVLVLVLGLVLGLMRIMLSVVPLSTYPTTLNKWFPSIFIILTLNKWFPSIFSGTE